MKLQFCGVTMMPALNLSCTMARCKFDGHTYTSHLARIASSQPEKFFTRSGSVACVTGLHFQLPPTIGLRNETPHALRPRDYGFGRWGRVLADCGAGAAGHLRGMVEEDRRRDS